MSNFGEFLANAARQLHGATATAQGWTAGNQTAGVANAVAQKLKGSATPIGQLYGEGVANARARNAVFAIENPTAATIGDMGGVIGATAQLPTLANALGAARLLGGAALAVGKRVAVPALQAGAIYALGSGANPVAAIKGVQAAPGGSDAPSGAPPIRLLKTMPAPLAGLGADPAVNAAKPLAALPRLSTANAPADVVPGMNWRDLKTIAGLRPKPLTAGDIAGQYALQLALQQNAANTTAANAMTNPTERLTALRDAQELAFKQFLGIKQPASAAGTMSILPIE